MGAAKRKRDRAEREAVFDRMQSEVAPIIDHAMLRLHDELAQWPDGWVSHKHGTDQNPHVFKPFVSGYEMSNGMVVVRGRELAVFSLGMTLVDPTERRCTCGLLERDHVAMHDIRYMLDGLLQRDVQ